MEFKEYLDSAEKSMHESAQLQLELVTKINSLISSADITVLRRVVKVLESGTEV
jgi:glutamine synthetase